MKNDERLMVRSPGIRDAVELERERLRRDMGLELTLSQTAASLIRQGLSLARNAGGNRAET
ncbi:MAG: hypothetical protein KDK11_15915 [Maritimibacter sp.]|nr:hypothetical protein [Maritimibacter sp.]